MELFKPKEKSKEKQFHYPLLHPNHWKSYFLNSITNPQVWPHFTNPVPILSVQAAVFLTWFPSYFSHLFTFHILYNNQRNLQKCKINLIISYLLSSIIFPLHQWAICWWAFQTHLLSSALGLGFLEQNCAPTFSPWHILFALPGTLVCRLFSWLPVPLTLSGSHLKWCFFSDHSEKWPPSLGGHYVIMLLTSQPSLLYDIIMVIYLSTSLLSASPCLE